MRIGCIDLGSRGFPSATHLVQAGFDVCSFDQTEPTLAVFANNGRHCAANLLDTAQNSSIVLSMLPRSEQGMALLKGPNALLPMPSTPRSLSMAPRLRSTRPSPSRRSRKPVAIGCIGAPVASRTHAAASAGMACGRGVELARTRPMPTARPTTSQPLLSSHAAKGHQHKGLTVFSAIPVRLEARLKNASADFGRPSKVRPRPALFPLHNKETMP